MAKRKKIVKKLQIDRRKELVAPVVHTLDMRPNDNILLTEGEVDDGTHAVFQQLTRGLQTITQNPWSFHALWNSFWHHLLFLD